jgi:hypothetical protein
MVGGDWYDAFVLPSGALCVVVGDIAGRGLPAAISMARLRNAVRAMAFVDETPSTTVSRMNDFLRHFDSGAMATILVGILNMEGSMRYANAGHMPPLVVNEQGRAYLVDEPAEPLLGAVGISLYRDRVLTLDPGAILLLYTDGLVERRGQSLDAGFEALRRAAETPWNNLDMLCARLLPTEESATGLEDDVALLALRFGSPPPGNPGRSSRSLRGRSSEQPSLSASRSATREGEIRRTISIRQTPSGKWQARYYDSSGRLRGKTFVRKTDARTFLATTKADLARGAWVDPGQSKTRLGPYANVGSPAG